MADSEIQREREMKEHPVSIKSKYCNIKKSASIFISILLLITMLSLFTAANVHAQSTFTFGNTVVGSSVDTNDANAQSVSYFKCTTSGSVTDIMAYIGGVSSGKVITALYAVSGSSAGALLSQSNSVSIGTSFSWVDFTLPSSISVVSGTTYGLAVMGNVGVNVMEVSGTGQRAHNAVSSFANGFANPFGGIWGSDTTEAMSIYASGITTSNPTSTPAPTSTPTASPIPTTSPTTTPTPSSTPSTQTTFGNTVVGSNVDTNDANAQSVSYFKCTTSGSVTDIMAYIGGVSSGKVITALYAVSGSSAGALLSQSNSVSIGTSFSWVDFTLPSSISVVSGTTYGLAVMGNVGVNVMEVSGTGQRAHNAVSSFANGFANPFGGIWGSDTTEAMSIYALCKTSLSTPTQAPTATPTPTPTATPKPTPSPTNTPQSSINFEPLSAFYSDANHYGYASVDSSTLHNGDPSIRVGPDYVRGTREVDGAWISVKPGDHIVFSCWIKTAAFSTSDPYAGARIGMDFYVQSSQGLGIATIDAQGHQAGHPNDVENVAGVCRVPWGNGWTLVTWDVYVPTTYFTYVTTGTAGNPCSCNSVQISSMVGWFSVGGVTDNAYAWFADSSLYVNP